MKLLIVTQSVDRDNPVLGFFHRWIEEFAKNFEKITVICLEKGTYSLPENVEVHSLGKEVKNFQFSIFNFQKLKYLFKYYGLIFRFRKEYDAVFVHMNQEYVLLAGDIWRLMGKRIYLWRNHAKGNILTRIAVLLSHKVFCTSPQSYTAKFKKTKIMPVGIDTDFFKPDSSIERRSNAILFLGRIAPVKSVDLFVDALSQLRKQGVEFTATIVGSALPKDAEYEKMLQDKVREYGLNEKVVFLGAVTQERTPELYRKHELYVNLTHSGSMDKTIFEAMACECLSVVTNRALSVISGIFFVASSSSSEIAKSIMSALGATDTPSCRYYVVENHSLRKLGIIMKDELATK